MKKIVLVKKDHSRAAGEDNWIVMNSYEFAMFMKTPEGMRRRPGFGVLPGAGPGDAMIIAECGEETAREWKSAANREYYLRKRNAEHGDLVFSYSVLSALSGGGHCGEETVWDEKVNVEKLVEERLTKEKLRGAVWALDPEERDLVEKMYLTEPPMTEEEYAATVGIKRHQANYRKYRVLKKLRRLLES